ncbi:MAG: acyl-CoA/acyl-ACP dehydrogenase [Kineosporiaceae bacterium]|nr:acyl-CoA/acyl-ACP dehydrogenase [Kineosporiaceae bacterium]
MESEVVQRARRLADEVLFPAAIDVDRAARVPARLLDALAQNGFYGLGAPSELSGLDLPDDAARAAVVEAFAGGCLSAAFVWLQHRGALRAVVSAASNASTVEHHLPELVAGRLRAGLAIGAATRTGPPLIRALTEPGGAWRFSGRAPWVTGWGMVDVLLMAARDADDQLIWALVPTDSPGLRPENLALLAVNASGTVTLTVDDVVVPAERVLTIEPHAAYLARDAESVTFNGFLAVGAAGRAIRLMREAGVDASGEDPFEGQVIETLSTELDQVRQRLLTATADDAPSARAAASELAMRAAAALAAHQGSRSVLAGSHAGRLIREATFLLTFGSRPAIRRQLLTRLAR